MVATKVTTSTGSCGRCVSRTSTSRIPRSSGMAISCTHVTPREAATPAAWSWYSSMRLSERLAWNQRWTAALASRRSTPVGHPLESRSTPSISSARDAEMAAALARETWPSARTTITGAGAAASSSSIEGTSGLSHRDSSKPCSNTASSLSAAAARMVSRSCRADVTSPRSGPACVIPVPVRCTCASTNPGMMVVPGTSTIRSAPGGSPEPIR